MSCAELLLHNCTHPLREKPLPYPNNDVTITVLGLAFGRLNIKHGGDL